MSNNGLNDIDMKKPPLQAFDFILTENRNPDLLDVDKRKNKKLLLRCILSEGGHANEAQKCDEHEIEELTMVFLDKFHEMINRENIAACYMRLLSEDDMNWTRSTPWRPKIIGALDNLLTDTLYKEWKINPTLQAHEKVPLLVDVVRKQEKEYR